MKLATCDICPRKCTIKPGGIGFCNARGNVDGVVTSINYGCVTSLALDPVEKKPLYHFHPGRKILSVGSFGCNLRCSHCQNHSISMCDKEHAGYEYIEPDRLVEYAVKTKCLGNIGVAYTYNEPLVGYEYVRDCAKLVREKGLCNCVVSNGYINEKPLLDIVEYVDAFNIDLKAFTDEFYKKANGDLETVKNTIKVAAKYSHVEVTTLIIPGENDSKEEIEELASWLGGINRDIPLHISRFFPRYKMLDKNPTPVEDVYSLAGIARRHLNHVYEGNC